MTRPVLSSVLLVFFSLVAALWTSSATAEVEKTVKYRLPDSPFEVYRGTTTLPAEGLWQVRAAPSETTLRAYLIPSDEVRRTQLGVRMAAALRQQRTAQGRWKVNSVHYACVQYAKRNGGIGPKTIDDLDGTAYRHLRDNLQKSPWYRDELLHETTEIDGPFVYLVPAAKFHFQDLKQGTIRADQREILAVELRPYVDDGKHWVLYTNGQSVRQAIDPQWIKQHGLTIRPVLARNETEQAAERTQLPYTVVVVRRVNKSPIVLDLFNPISGDEKRLSWSVADAASDSSVRQTLQQAREMAWSPYLATSAAPVLRAWRSRSVSSNDDNRRRRDANELSMFSLLGGRAAVEETLQLQDLTATESDTAETVDVSSIKGVEVKSHPFEQMLLDQLGGQLPLADVVPDDRFMVYVAKPESILPFLDHGADYLATLGAGFTGNQLDYDLSTKYLGRMGVSREWLETVIRSGLVQEMAVVLPDLFLIDGTDVTVVARLRQPGLLSGLLRVLGLPNLPATGVIKNPAADGRISYWALRDDLLMVSTHEAELNRVLDLAEQEGQGSLGQSAEFRYMLTQLPINAETRMYVYFSDPFIRRLVGPQVKLAQRRRIKARATMEALTSLALLARLDGVDASSVDDLARMEYLPDGFPRDEYWIDEVGVVHSKSYGPLPGMKSLPDLPLDRVTPEEAEAYRRYVENYSRFWRQFFDPIAVRLDEKAGGEMELTTFILPLINSSIYDQLRRMIVDHSDGRSLVVPHIEPTPVVQMSVNLQEDAWRDVAEGFSDFFRRYGGASPALLDDLGPGFHFALFDADPVIALGSGDVMGAFGGNLLRAGGNEMLMIPVALSMLTRPCSAYIETRDPERTARYLRQAASGWASPSGVSNNGIRVSFYQVDDQDSWVWTMEVMGVVKVRFGVEVSDRYLVIRNIPWSNQDKVVISEDAPLNGAMLTATPSACRLQLPGLFASAADQERRAVLGNLGRLYPFVVSQGGDVQEALDRHAQLFGFRPVHPRGGQFAWENMKMKSSLYGSVDRQRQPAFDPTRPFGLMHGIDSVRLSMQFEDSGLRSKITWRSRRTD